MTKKQARALAKDMVDMRRCYSFSDSCRSGKATLCGRQVGTVANDGTMDCGNNNSLSYNAARRIHADLVEYYTNAIHNGEYAVERDEP
jgi:hypothetical protein